MHRRASLLLLLASCQSTALETFAPELDDTTGPLEVVIEGGTNVVPDAFPTVGAALADAALDHEVTTVLVRAGVYDELPLAVVRPDLRIVGEGDVRIRGVTPGQAVVHFAAGSEGSTLDGVTVEAAAPVGGTAILVEDHVGLANVELIGTPSAAMLEVRAANVVLEDSVLHDFGVGIRTTHGSVAHVLRSRVRNGAVGVVIEGGTNLRAMHSLLHDLDTAVSTDGTAHVQHVTIARTAIGVSVGDAGAEAHLSNVAAHATAALLSCAGGMATASHVYTDGAVGGCVAEGVEVVDDLGLDADLRPEQTSVLVDAGTPLPDPEAVLDIDSTPRPVDGDFDGHSAPDVGAFESCSPTCPNWVLDEVRPGVGTWQQGLEPVLPGTCDADPMSGAAWRGRVVTAAADSLTLEYFLTDPSLVPSRAISWSLVRTDQAPDCSSLADLPVVASGTHPADTPTLRLAVDPWVGLPTDDPFAAEVVRRLLLVTGDDAAPDAPVLFSPFAFEVRRSCE
jgi:hypothetical protein